MKSQNSLGEKNRKLEEEEEEIGFFLRDSPQMEKW
jgi:hypothetical protein